MAAVWWDNFEAYGTPADLERLKAKMSDPEALGYRVRFKPDAGAMRVLCWLSDAADVLSMMERGIHIGEPGLLSITHERLGAEPAGSMRQY